MTLEEKASLLSGKDCWSTTNIDHLNVRSLLLSDGPHGLRKQVKEGDHLGLNPSYKATCFPTAATMANSFDCELGYKLGKTLGEEAVCQGVDVVLGPGINIKKNPKCGRNFEYFSEDPYLAGKMAASYIKGIQENGVSACVKHFAVNSQETNRMTLNSVVDERTLREIYLTNFEIAVKEGKPLTLMSSYNLINGTYANENKKLLVDILRKEWGFNGLVVTDWGGDNERISALKCFNSLEMPSNNGDTDREIIRAVKDGSLDESIVDKNVDYLLTLIDSIKINQSKKDTLIETEKDHQVARECAEGSAVLLKNKDNILPLKEDSKIALIGDFIKNPRYQGAGSSIVNPSKLENVFDEIKNYKLDVVGYEPGFKRYGGKSSSLISKAVNLAKKADILLVFLGLDEITEAEGLDRADIKLHQNQIDLIDELSKLDKKIVVVLSSGSLVEMSFDEKCDAILDMYLGGEAGASAALNILTGKVNPSGKLAESIPFKYEDCILCDEFPSKGISLEYREGIFVGYRYYDTNNIKVRYPFGFGLSYAHFNYETLKISNEGVNVTIKNSGLVEGKEVIELYIGKKDSKIFRVKKELKGFAKVNLKPRETKEIYIPFDDKSFRFFNVKSNEWEIEDGRYEIYIGSSVEDIRLEGSIEIKGNMTCFPYNFKELPSYFNGEVAKVTDKEFELLLGKKIPPKNLNFYKKNRIVTDYNTTVADLKYARGWSGRFFSWAIRFAIKFLKKVKKYDKANTLIMGVLNQPMRGISRLTGGAISYGQLDGLIMMFNGHFFKGLHYFFRKTKEKKSFIKKS